MNTKPETLLTTRIFRVEQVTQMIDGAPHQRAIVRHPGAVVILPLLADDRVCLIQNFRVSVNATLIELPAGTLEPNEPPEQTAARELIEETGFVAGRIDKLHEFFASPGILDERMHLFIARDLTEGPTAREAGEQIENRIVTWDQAMDLVDRGEIRDAKTLVGLLWWDRQRRNG